MSLPFCISRSNLSNLAAICSLLIRYASFWGFYVNISSLSPACCHDKPQRQVNMTLRNKTGRFHIKSIDDDDNARVDGVRLRLWTAATSWPIAHPPGDIWAWRTMVEWYRQRKPSDSFTRTLCQSQQQSYVVAKQQKMTKEVMNFALRGIYLILRSVL
jgi:hypothetical protein